MAKDSASTPPRAFSPRPLHPILFSPPDAQEVCTTSLHTKDAQEVGAAQEVQSPAPLDPTLDAPEPHGHTRLAQEVVSGHDVHPGPPSPTPAHADEMAPTHVPAGYGNAQGRGGKRMLRINMAFSPENYAWIKRQTGPYHTMTEIVNEIIYQARRNNYGH